MMLKKNLSLIQLLTLNCCGLKQTVLITPQQLFLDNFGDSFEE